MDSGTHMLTSLNILSVGNQLKRKDICYVYLIVGAKAEASFRGQSDIHRAKARGMIKAIKSKDRVFKSLTWGKEKLYLRTKGRSRV
jgi:hypothetical protein